MHKNVHTFKFFYLEKLENYKQEKHTSFSQPGSFKNDNFLLGTLFCTQMCTIFSYMRSSPFSLSLDSTFALTAEVTLFDHFSLRVFEASKIQLRKSSTLRITVLVTLLFINPQTKKSQGLRSGNLGCQATVPPRPIHVE